MTTEEVNDQLPYQSPFWSMEIAICGTYAPFALGEIYLETSLAGQTDYLPRMVSTSNDYGCLTRDLCYSLIAILPLILVFIGVWTRSHSATPVVGSGLCRLSSLVSLYNMKELFQTGFQQYPDSAFCIQVFPFGKVTVLTNRELINEMRRAPFDVLSFEEVSHALILPEYTCFGSAPDHPITVIRRDFSRKFDLLLPDMIDEIAAGTASVLIQSTEVWHEVVVQNLVVEITSQISLCAMVGRPLCHNLKLRRVILSFVKGATRTAFWINLFPQALHSIVAPFISPANHHRKQLQRIITPLIDERRRKLRELGQEWDKPGDYLMCLIESAPPGRSYESSHEGIAARLLQFSFASIHTSTNAMSHLLLDLAASKLNQDILREEMCGTVSDAGITKESMQKMHYMDSFMRESARLNPVGISADRLCNIGLTSLSCFARRTYTFSDHKTVIPKGSVVMASMDAIHRDETVYADPHNFNPWRFANLRSQSSEVFKHQYVSTNPNYLAFGHGKRACPGRFFAALELKATLTHLLMHYDMKLKDGILPQNDDLGIGVLPRASARVMFRRRGQSAADKLRGLATDSNRGGYTQVVNTV